jgi:hypothetical protein
MDPDAQDEWVDMFRDDGLVLEEERLIEADRLNKLIVERMTALSRKRAEVVKMKKLKWERAKVEKMKKLNWERANMERMNMERANMQMSNMQMSNMQMSNMQRMKQFRLERLQNQHVGQYREIRGLPLGFHRDLVGGEM